MYNQNKFCFPSIQHLYNCFVHCHQHSPLQTLSYHSRFLVPFSSVSKPSSHIISVVTSMKILWYDLIFMFSFRHRPSGAKSTHLSFFSHLSVDLSLILSTELHFSTYFYTIPLLTEAISALYLIFISFENSLCIISNLLRLPYPRIVKKAL